MPATTIRYELDITGVNPDNLVIGELHNLNDREVRAITPVHGPFFTSQLQVYDNTTGRILTRGLHYQCVELLQDATLKYGKEICSVILIIDKTISHDVKITYQALGGHFSNDATAIANLYETVMQDERPVQWVNLLNKPAEYPPALHRHLLEDLYGFEPVVAALERIRNAIVLSDVPAFEALIDYVHQRVSMLTCKEATTIRPVRKIVTYDRLLVTLSKLGILSGYKIAYLPERVPEGGSFNVQITSKDVPDGTTIYWEIVHNTTDDDDFIASSGEIVIRDNRGSFTIQLVVDALSEPAEQFSLMLKERADSEDCLYVSCSIQVQQINPSIDDIDIWDLYRYPDTALASTSLITPAKLFMFSNKGFDDVLRRSGYTGDPENMWDLFRDPDIYRSEKNFINPSRLYMSSSKETDNLVFLPSRYV